jgi:hypothetical protein
MDDGRNTEGVGGWAVARGGRFKVFTCFNSIDGRDAHRITIKFKSSQNTTDVSRYMKITTSQKI